MTAPGEILHTGAADYPGLDEWRRLPIRQQPDWRDHPDFDAAVGELSSNPPLVFAGEVDKLKRRLAKVAQGEAFLLQGGDCAETFAGATADKISARVKTLLQMAVVLTYGASLPVVKMGRMAGQFAKPRSSDMETRGEVTLPSFRGEIINGFDFTEESRHPDPKRMVQAYHTSAATLNLVRAFTEGGFADLRAVQQWNKGFMENPAHARYESIAGEIDRAVRFMEACGADFDGLKRTEFYAAHEALLLDYERALTRIDSRTGEPYVTSGHFVWIGERTRELDGAHVDYLSRVHNPLGVKLGPGTTPEDALALIDKLDPQREPGRLTFITRMGAKNIREKLPPLVEAVRDSGAKVVWVTDPMHGNTITAKNGYKTRQFDDVMDEVRGFFEVHRSLGTYPGGLHVEMTGDDVAECLGGSDIIDESAFDSRYESLCDPRLNHKQSLEMAFLVAEALTQVK
ncbi:MULTISPECIES: class II 3-deoxy-7-phosphoheptulonate synthase [unclassified Nesterenkonia]|uniref:class II 3-deoxy-7-phosphoheptulonate synthase n=1 Tax=unclassified Nesterenkonia TaxID=2629769 RepID=UPI0008733240|nr:MULTISPECIES: 3-deoxy-7-phosphoheptulonate synthase class II [unclassified Nesterenkonia]MDS2171481.1 3-deoxy-7-phosphoheptulonate synthase class II [Nesterenkonia sp. CL21]OSM44374.1 3-deoxy-7-phosphoheptulonate synthase class II [Nesterenkonia sp. PF2B19]